MYKLRLWSDLLTNLLIFKQILFLRPQGVITGKFSIMVETIVIKTVSPLVVFQLISFHIYKENNVSARQSKLPYGDITLALLTCQVTHHYVIKLYTNLVWLLIQIQQINLNQCYLITNKEQMYTIDFFILQTP